MKKPTPIAISLFLFVLMLAFIMESCVDHTLPALDAFNCSSGEVSFDNDIQPIIATKCAITGDGGCHNGGNGPTLNWNVFTNFQSHATSVKDRVTRPVGTSGHMPKIGTITDEQIRLLVCWVDQGAQDN